MREKGDPLPSKEESKVETKRRLAVIGKITGSIKGIPEAIMVGGSMAWGQNIAVRKASDIDMTIIATKEQLPALASTNLIKGKIPQYLIEAFNSGFIDVIYIRSNLDGIELNNFIHNPDSYKGYCSLEKSLRIFTTAFKPGGHLKGYGFDGVLRSFNVDVESFEDGYIYPRPVFYENQYYGNPVRADHLYCSWVIEEKNKFITNAEKDFWRTSVAQLRKEYGPNPNLNKTNILNTSYVYMTDPDILPKGIIEKIKERTVTELSRDKKGVPLKVR